MNILLLSGGLATLLAGAESLVRGSSALALRLDLTPLVIGLTVVAFGTSTPELAVSIQAALQGNGGLIMGNVIGSNIANIGLTLGIVALITPVVVHRQVSRIDIPFMLFISLLVYGLSFGNEMQRLTGIILFSLLLIYLGWSLHTARRKPDNNSNNPYNNPELTATDAPRPTNSLTLEIILIICGLVLLVIGARWLVSGAVEMAKWAGISKAIIGLTIIAVGTSLPELATSLVAAYRQQTDMAIGNIVGSNIFNLLSILGLTAIVQPFLIRDITSIDWLVMLGLSFIIWPLAVYRNRLSRWHGFILFIAYCSYIMSLALRTQA